MIYLLGGVNQLPGRDRFKTEVEGYAYGNFESHFGAPVCAFLQKIDRLEFEIILTTGERDKLHCFTFLRFVFSVSHPRH